MIRKLSQKEKDVLRWTAQGKTAWETGQILNVSQRTVEWHLLHIYRKFDISTKTAAVMLAVKAGLLFFLCKIGSLITTVAPLIPDITDTLT